MNKGSFWENKKVLVTGHTGFKGTWLTLLLNRYNATVYGISLPSDNEFVSDSFYQSIRPKVEVEELGDITDYAFSQKAVEKCAPEIVIHMAAHSSLYKSMEMPHHIINTNMTGTLNILEAVRNTSSVKCVVIVTSDKVYSIKDYDGRAFDESDPLDGEDPYATSKIAQELLTKCYSKSFFEKKGVGVATARACNCIGPGDYNHARLVPYIIESCMKGAEVDLRNPFAERTWISVLDCVSGYLAIAEALYEHRTKEACFNISTGDAGIVTVGDLAQRIASGFGLKVDTEKKLIPQQMKETAILKLENKKALTTLDWYPIQTINDVVYETVEYEKRQRAGLPNKENCMIFLDHYMECTTNNGVEMK